MPRNALFAGLVFDENGQPAETALVGGDPCYVLNDAGFHRHISAEQIDRQVLQHMQDMIKGSEGLISEQTAKMLGQEDLFSVAAIEQQLKNMDKQFDTLMQTGLPEEARAYLGMMGFKIVVDYHGQVLRVEQPGGIDEEGDE
ncbi:MAG: hypothetical protein ACK2T2_11930 [Anaerolineales bacterium]|jgi:hypothetical protein